jgi:hypothetical protein
VSFFAFSQVYSSRHVVGFVILKINKMEAKNFQVKEGQVFEVKKTINGMVEDFPPELVFQFIKSVGMDDWFDFGVLHPGQTFIIRRVSLLGDKGSEGDIFEFSTNTGESGCKSSVGHLMRLLRDDIIVPQSTMDLGIFWKWILN